MAAAESVEHQNYHCNNDDDDLEDHDDEDNLEDNDDEDNNED